MNRNLKEMRSSPLLIIWEKASTEALRWRHVCDAEGTARRPVRLDWGWRWHGTEMGSERDKEARSCRV